MRFAFTNLRAALCMLVGAVAFMSVQNVLAKDSLDLVTIDRIAFLIHPFCYRVPRPEDYNSSSETRERWDQYIASEKKTAERWFDGIANLGSNEALVICAGRVGCPPDLRDYAQKQLGRRAVVIEEYLDQRSDFSEGLSTQAKMSIAEELVTMYQRYGHDWSPQSFALPITARGWAERLLQEFKERGLTFDPTTVRADAWGESFEGCVASYARYLGPALGLARPIENHFHMTVPDAPFLLNARFLEKIHLERDVRLFLWETDDKQFVAHFQKARTTVIEPALFVCFSVEGLQVEVKNKSGRQVWPRDLPHEKGSADEAINRYNEQRRRKVSEWEETRYQKASSIITFVEGQLQFPLALPLGIEVSFSATYIFARGVPLDRFRSVMANAQIVERAEKD